MGVTKQVRGEPSKECQLVLNVPYLSIVHQGAFFYYIWTRLLEFLQGRDKIQRQPSSSLFANTGVLLCTKPYKLYHTRLREKFIEKEQSPPPTPS